MRYVFIFAILFWLVSEAFGESKSTVTNQNGDTLIVHHSERNDSFGPRKGWHCRTKVKGSGTDLDCSGPSIKVPILKVSCKNSAIDVAKLTLIDGAGWSKLTLACRK